LQLKQQKTRQALSFDEIKKLLAKHPKAPKNPDEFRRETIKVADMYRDEKIANMPRVRLKEKDVYEIFRREPEMPLDRARQLLKSLDIYD